MSDLDKRLERFDHGVELREESSEVFLGVWKDYDLYTSMEYWMMVGMLVIPLIVLFFKIDKTKLFHIGFFGYSYHTTFAYGDLIGMNQGNWHYPFQLIPLLPSLSIDASLAPVTFMLIYQWSINHKKNYYLYASITCGIFSFGLKPILVQLGLFRFYEGFTYYHLLIVYLMVALVAKQIVNVFLWVEKKYTRKIGNTENLY